MKTFQILSLTALISLFLMTSCQKDNFEELDALASMGQSSTPSTELSEGTDSDEETTDSDTTLIIDSTEIDEQIQLSEEDLGRESKGRSGRYKLWETTAHLSHGKWFSVWLPKHYLDPHCRYYLVITPIHGNPDAYIHARNDYGMFRYVRSSNNTHGVDETYAMLADLRHDEGRLYASAYGRTACQFKITIYKECGQHQNCPTVHFDSPTNGSHYNAGKDLYVNVDAHDPSGIDYVELYVNGQFVRKETKAPYEWGKPHSHNDHWLNNMQPGTYVLKCIAKNYHGCKVAKEITIHIDHVGGTPGPNMHFVNIAHGDRFPQGKDLYVKCNAHSSYGMKYVELYVNGHYVRKESRSPWEWGKPHSHNDHPLNNMQPGTYVIKAIGTDLAGYKTTKEVTIYVDPHSGGGQGPTVSFSNISHGSSYPAGKYLYVKVNAHDPHGVQYCELYVNGQKVRRENHAPYEWGKPHADHDYALNNMQRGTYIITCIAKDHHGYRTRKDVTIYIH